MLHRHRLNEKNVQRKERGIVLLITLIALVAMTLASIGMVRSVDTSVLAVGNMAFRQAAEAPVDWAVEDAMQTIQAMAPTDPNNPSGTGYFANIQASTNGIPNQLLMPGAPTGVFNQTDAAGNTLYYMIERMCRQAGVPVAGDCIPALLAGEEDGGEGVLKPIRNTAGEHSTWYEYSSPDGSGVGGGSGSYVYRVTVRVDGPNSTRAYAQAMIRS